MSVIVILFAVRPSDGVEYERRLGMKDWRFFHSSDGCRIIGTADSCEYIESEEQCEGYVGESMIGDVGGEKERKDSNCGCFRDDVLVVKRESGRLAARVIENPLASVNNR